MLTHGRRLLILAAVLILISAHPRCAAEPGGGGTYRAVSDSLVPFLLAGELVIGAEGEEGSQEAVQAAKALVASTLVTQALKLAIPVERPDGGNIDSFPSGHTSAAFAMATCIAEYRPEYTLLAYGAATAIGYSRIEVNAHRWDEVVAGALIGYYVAKHFTRHHGDVEAGPVGISIAF